METIKFSQPTMVSAIDLLEQKMDDAHGVIDQELKMACKDRKNIWNTLVKQDRQIVASRILLVVVIALMLVIGYRYMETVHRVDELEQWNLYLQEELNEVKTLQDMYIKG